MTDEIPLCTQIIEQSLFHEKACKLLVAFAASTSNLFTIDLKNIHENSQSSLVEIRAEVQSIRSIINSHRNDNHQSMEVTDE